MHVSVCLRSVFQCGYLLADLLTFMDLYILSLTYKSINGFHAHPCRIFDIRFISFSAHLINHVCHLQCMRMVRNALLVGCVGANFKT